MIPIASMTTDQIRREIDACRWVQRAGILADDATGPVVARLAECENEMANRTETV